MRKVKEFFAIGLFLTIVFGGLYLHSLVMSDPGKAVDWAYRISHGK